MKRSRSSPNAWNGLAPLGGRLAALAAAGTLLGWLAVQPRVVQDVERRARGSAATTASLLVPVRGVAASAFGDSFSDPREGERLHEAIDIPARRGALVVAAAAGRVRRIFSSPRGGLGVYQVDRGEGRCFYYAHLDRYASGLREGVFLNRGDRIGYVGTTGNAPDDVPHLHFAVRVLDETAQRCAEGVPVNPYHLFRDVGASTAR